MIRTQFGKFFKCKLYSRYIIVLILFLDTYLCQLSNPQQPKITRNTKQQSRDVGECPTKFLRLSNKCYYLSDTSETWLNSFYKCKDMKSEMVTLNRASEDRNLKKLLQHGKKTNRWIGGILNGQTWTWGKTADVIKYNGFSKAENVTKNGKLYCLIMDATQYYRWSPEDCFTKNYFICQRKLNRRKIHKPEQNHNLNKMADYEKRLKKNKRLRKISGQELNNNINSETQNDGAAYANRKKPRQMVNLLNRVMKRCRDRDEAVLKHINSTLSDTECVNFFIERWQRRQRKTRDNRAKELQLLKINRIRPKTLIKYRNSELHPARIEESHDVHIQ